MAATHFIECFESFPPAEQRRQIYALKLAQLQILQNAFDVRKLAIDWEVAVAMAGRLYPDPPKPDLPAATLLPQEMAEIMTIRAGQGMHLYHDFDAIQRGAGERFARRVHNARNGSNVFGEPEVERPEAPTDDDDWRDNLLADFYARRNK
jgi:hypothetical protein